jgi:hypothetical protein
MTPKKSLKDHNLEFFIHSKLKDQSIPQKLYQEYILFNTFIK